MAQNKDVDKIVRGPAVLTVNGGSVGFIVDVATFRHQQDYLDCDVSDSNAPVKSEVIKEMLMVGFTLQQVDMESFKIALGKTSNVGGGGDAATATPIPLTFTFGGWVFTVHKAVPTKGLDLSVERNNWTKVPIEFKGLSDMTKPAGERLYSLAAA